jgi:hypothetical protein
VPKVPEVQSTPVNYNFNGNALDLSYGHRRAKLNWYSIDPTIYVQTPGDIGQDGIP